MAKSKTPAEILRDHDLNYFIENGFKEVSEYFAEKSFDDPVVQKEALEFLIMLGEKNWELNTRLAKAEEFINYNFGLVRDKFDEIDRYSQQLNEKIEKVRKGKKSQRGQKEEVTIGDNGKLEDIENKLTNLNDQVSFLNDVIFQLTEILESFNRDDLKELSGKMQGE